METSNHIPNGELPKSHTSREIKIIQMENTNTEEKKLKWYNYIAAFFAGVFLANVIPHYVNGISGDAFPSPFANPPGKGLSSPLVNVLWALFNLVVGYFLFKGGKINSKNKLALLVFFIGIALISIMCSMTFAEKVKL